MKFTIDEAVGNHGLGRQQQEAKSLTLDFNRLTSPSHWGETCNSMHSTECVLLQVAESQGTDKSKAALHKRISTSNSMK